MPEIKVTIINSSQGKIPILKEAKVDTDPLLFLKSGDIVTVHEDTLRDFLILTDQKGFIYKFTEGLICEEVHLRQRASFNKSIDTVAPAPSSSASTYVTPMRHEYACAQYLRSPRQNSNKFHCHLSKLQNTMAEITTFLHHLDDNPTTDNEYSGAHESSKGVYEVVPSLIEVKSGINNACEALRISDRTGSFPPVDRLIQSSNLRTTHENAPLETHAYVTAQIPSVQTELQSQTKESIVVESGIPGGGVITQFLLDAVFIVSAAVFTLLVVLFSLVFAIAAVASPGSRTGFTAPTVSRNDRNIVTTEQSENVQKVSGINTNSLSQGSRSKSFNGPDLSLVYENDMDKNFQKRACTPTTDVMTVTTRESDSSSHKSLSHDLLRQPVQRNCGSFEVCNRKLTREEMMVLVEEFDTDKNGKLTQDELDVAIQKFASEKRTMKRVITDKAYRIIRKYDLDRNGEIDPNEMAILASDVDRASKLKLSQTEVEFLIKKFDTDKNGKLSDVELMDGIRKFKLNSMTTEDDEEFRRILEKFDVNEDGTLSLHELKVISEEVANPKIPLWISVSTILQGVCLVEHTFSVGGWINFYWEDSDLPNRQSVEKGFTIEDDGENIPISVANLFQNSVKNKILGGPYYKYDHKAQVVSMSVHFTATFSEFLELEQFPFDRQYLTMRICVRTNEFHVLSEPPDFVPSRLKLRTMASYYESSSVVGYKFLSPVIGTCTAPNHFDDARITISFRVERQPNYYINNVVLPIFMIVSITPVTFAIAPDSIADRMGIILSLLLTMITFKFVISEQIPKVSTMTLLDKYFVLCYCLFLAATTQTLVLNFCVDAAYWRSINLVAGILFEINWVGLHVWMLNLSIQDSFYIPWAEMKDEDVSKQKLLLVQKEHIDPPSKYC